MQRVVAPTLSHYCNEASLGLRSKACDHYDRLYAWLTDVGIVQGNIEAHLCNTQTAFQEGIVKCSPACFRSWRPACASKLAVRCRMRKGVRLNRVLNAIERYKRLIASRNDMLALCCCQARYACLANRPLHDNKRH